MSEFRNGAPRDRTGGRLETAQRWRPPKLRWSAPRPDGWEVVAVARNMLVETYRSPSRTGLLPTMEEPAAEMHGAFTSLRRCEAVRMLRSEVEAINPLYGEAVRLRLDGLGPREIGERLGVSQHTIRSRLARGLAELRERFVGRRDSIELEL